MSIGEREEGDSQKDTAIQMHRANDSLTLVLSFMSASKDAPSISGVDSADSTVMMLLPVGVVVSFAAVIVVSFLCAEFFVLSSLLPRGKSG